MAAAQLSGNIQSVRNLLVARGEPPFVILSTGTGSEHSTEPTMRTHQFVRSDFDAAVDNLRQRFESRQSTTADAQEVLNHAALIDRFVNRRRLEPRVQQDWSAVRLQLNQLATAYGVTWPTVARGAGRRTTPLPSNSNNELTGTYRLDVSRSDDPREAASRATPKSAQSRSTKGQ